MSETEKPKAEKAEKPATMFVMDTTAAPDSYDGNGKLVPGFRVHDIILDGAKRSFKFEAGKPTELPAVVAMKFLKHDALKATDKDGELIKFERPPRQPDELGAGERLELKVNETVARLDELSIPALMQRVLPIPGGEKFGAMPDKPTKAVLEEFRAEMVRFLVDHKAATAKANTSTERDVKPGEYTPEAEFEDEAA
jgi:hypothetical protein